VEALVMLLLSVVVAVVVVLVWGLGVDGLTSMMGHKERAAGVHPELRALLDAWDAFGTHKAVVAYEGGKRTDAAKQASYAASGTSNAATLETTPHGRGAAVDVYPASFLPHLALRTAWPDLPQQVRDEFEAFGVFAEGRGFTWGGRWRSAKFPYGDQPHVELRNWKSLPFPGAYP
jgi:D-alanyl-D-alanine carboxypeptidase